MTSFTASPTGVSGTPKPSVPIPYPAGAAPSITLAITPLRDPDAPGPTIYVSMIVDSGANVSLLAKEHLRELGIRQRGAQAEIERDRAPALGVRSRFPTVVTFVEDAEAPSYILTQR